MKTFHRKSFLKSAVHKIVLLSLMGFAVAGNATSLSITPTNRIDTFDQEPGQSIPTGVAGWVNGTLFTDGGMLTFTYGRDLGLVAGATGYGNASFLNEFMLTINPTQNCFANYAGSSCLNVGNNPFTVNIGAGAVPFEFRYNLNSNGNGGHTLLNGGSNPGNGAYLAAGSLGSTPFGGPTSTVYLGLADQTYPSGDHDFQDIALSITAVPEPDTYAMMLAGLGLLGFIGRRRLQRDD